MGDIILLGFHKLKDKNTLAIKVYSTKSNNDLIIYHDNPNKDYLDNLAEYKMRDIYPFLKVIDFGYDGKARLDLDFDI